MPRVSTDQTKKRSRREDRPETINIGIDELIRNDVLAKRHGTTERTVNRGDAEGAPFTYIGNVKYRPQREYNEFLVGRIRRRNTATPRRRRLRSEAREAR